jgi:hypothetical protein
MWQSHQILVKIFCNNITSGTCFDKAVNSLMHQSVLTSAEKFYEMLQYSSYICWSWLLRCVRHTPSSTIWTVESGVQILLGVCMYVCMYVRVYVCMCVCVCVYTKALWCTDAPSSSKESYCMSINNSYKPGMMGGVGSDWPACTVEENNKIQWVVPNFLGAFAKLRTATINAVMSVCVCLSSASKNSVPTGRI